MVPDYILWVIFLLPLFSLIFIGLFLRPFFNNSPKLSGYTIIGCLAIAFGLSVWVFTSSDQFPIESSVEWVVVGDFVFDLAFWADRLTAIMLIVVTSVSLLVQIYSTGYMHGDPGYHRYFAFMSLFTASMLGLVLASNTLLLFVFWEGVGLGSYLLIGYWFHKPSAAAAAKKAFIVTRFGDFGFLVAILILYFAADPNTFNIHDTYDAAGNVVSQGLNSQALLGIIGGTTLTLATLGLFSGAVGKSAQFPLHTWLPDAMEGPTPVSSLIHAATMVAAGIYLVARTMPMFVSADFTIEVVAVIGGVTAIFAASMGLVMNDIKRVLAYSTISQLGYMMLGLGAAGIAASEALAHGHGGEHVMDELIQFAAAVGIFHLFTHAFFKCLLFLGAGSVSHGSGGTFDMRLMGGLRKYMPWTFGVFLIGAFSLSGIWPLSGFWSKDLILIEAWENTPVLFWLAFITVFMTAFYMFRVVFMTFSGKYRGGEPSHGGHGHDDHSHGEPHESPKVMIIPMVALAIPSIFVGWHIWSGGAFQYLGGHSHGFFDVFTKAGEEPIPLLSLLLALSGIGLAYAMYKAKWLSAEKAGRAFAPLYTLFSRKYYMDELYEDIIVRRILYNGLFWIIDVFDTYVVDGIVNGVARGTATSGGVLRRVQTGQLQAYGLAIVLGILIIALIWLVYR